MPTIAEPTLTTPRGAPCAIVIFGASGDLTKRKLLPALYNLHTFDILPAGFAIIGVARRVLSLHAAGLFRRHCATVGLFQRSDMVEAGWRVVEPILDVWQALPPRISEQEFQESLLRCGRPGQGWFV